MLKWTTGDDIPLFWNQIGNGWRLSFLSRHEKLFLLYLLLLAALGYCELLTSSGLLRSIESYLFSRVEKDASFERKGYDTSTHWYRIHDMGLPQVSFPYANLSSSALCLKPNCSDDRVGLLSSSMRRWGSERERSSIKRLIWLSWKAKILERSSQVTGS